MKELLTPCVTPRGPAAPRPALFKTLTALALALLLAAFCPAPAAAQDSSAGGQKQERQEKTRAASPFDEDDESGDDEEEAPRPRVTDPATILRNARVIRVNSKTAFVNEHEVEDSLRKRKEFAAWGMTITRNDSEADLIIEITRKSLTRRFTFTVVDPRTMLVVTSGKTRSVLFGKKIPNKIAEKFANRVKTVRPYPPVASSRP